MKTRTNTTRTFSFITAFCLLLLSASFTTAGKAKPACDIYYAYTSSRSLTFASIEDSHSDEIIYNITPNAEAGGTFSYASGSLIFSAQVAGSTHPGGTFTLTDITTSTVVDTETVPANSTAIYLLVENSPTCGHLYELKFQ